jgi:hypothetical protein
MVATGFAVEALPGRIARAELCDYSARNLPQPKSAELFASKHTD